MPTGHPVGYDFDALALFERELDGDVGIGSAIQDLVNGLDDKVPVDDDNVILYGQAGSARDARASAGMALGVTGVRQSGDVNGNVAPAVD